MNKQNLDTFIGYVNIHNPDWFKRMCNNLFKIKHYEWHVHNSWGGHLWQRKQLTRLIKKLKADNQRILAREYPIEHFPEDRYGFVFDFWKDRKGQNVPILEIWQKK